MPAVPADAQVSDMRQSRRGEPRRNPRPRRTGYGRTQREQQRGSGQQVRQQRMPRNATAAARPHVPEYGEFDSDQHEDQVDDAAGSDELLHRGYGRVPDLASQPAPNGALSRTTAPLSSAAKDTQAR